MAMGEETVSSNNYKITSNGVEENMEEDDEIEVVDLENDDEEGPTKEESTQQATVDGSEVDDKNVFCVYVSGSRNVTAISPVPSGCGRFVYLASGSQVFVYSTQSGEKTFTFTKHKGNLVGIQRFNGKTDQVWSCDENGYCCLWDHKTGAIIKEHNFFFKKFRAYSFYAPHTYETVYVGKGTKRQKTAKNPQNHFVKWDFATHSEKPVVSEPHTPNEGDMVVFGCGHDCPVMACLKPASLSVFNLKRNQENRFDLRNNPYTCVALHPDDFIMATGDKWGRVLIWHDFLESQKPIQTVYHWHTLPVRCVAFSDEGSFFLSGGGENTLVKWNMESKTRSYLPRMGAPITSVACAPGNEVFVTGHSDNSIRIISPLLRIVQTVSGMVKHEPIPYLKGKEALVPTGLVYDPRSRAIILNGIPGHLQFYDVEKDRLLYNLDITNCNIVTQERNKTLVNNEVVRVAVSSNGLWLATVERWPSPKGTVDVQLKFWQFNTTQQMFVLNTQVAKPHENEVHSIAFQPGEGNTQFPVLVTTGGQDGLFKLWRLADETDIYGAKVGWNCDVVGEFRRLPAGKVSFSEDGSLFAVAFHEILTIWGADNVQLKTTLSHNCITDRLDWVEFGRKGCCHLLVCGFGSTLLTWDLLSLTLKWKVGIRSTIASLVVDPQSDYMAVFTATKDIYAFQPSSPELVFQKKNSHSQQLLAATFMPRKVPLRTGIPWLESSGLVFIDGKQNLVTLESSRQSETTSANSTHLPENLPFTPFAALRAQTRKSDVTALQPKVHTSRGIAGFDTVKSLLENPGSTLPPVNRLCGHFLESLLSRLDVK